MSTVNHGLDRVRATFDDEVLIADAGLILVATRGTGSGRTPDGATRCPARPRTS